MSNNHLNINQLLSCDNYSTIDRTPQQELLHQAHSYSLAIRGFIITSVLLYLVGIGSFVAGKVPEGTINTASELTLKILFVLVKLDRQNTDRLNRLSIDQD
ncbi:MAG: hypothetical protein JGK03_02415 [Microcoleus sp. PH2017_25_DOB_D_A]|uniref:hypothetical protein n=1 Tax=unclassified Microcoleus TaxID=2642155 RepID=UPI001D557DF5|nr:MULTISPECIES: hypothetical protein [unclassified Microcoleus]TAE43254.1 MAG: hypothetical protein EAZ90_11340 [Oscillatoriales cyanobacterium]MCC3453887.1 hypothetical protein [Microcoleus sp. PH2017_08_TRC_O_A]MCC3489714.1 hypothetical protein [Microcoleus sp. PH2017_16_JOR_D_A]MCC3533070.1 hypothetical protein [Microcoleus sp. PH2017_25_DOB_D_A]MCC3545267.1 hypothetical protein [Microcoleus sp. PH2017_24_DOB_U_A]